MKNQSYTAVINGEIVKSVDPEDRIDVIKRQDGSFHLLINNKSHLVELVDADYSSRIFTFQSGIDQYQIKLKTDIEVLVEQMGFGTNGKARETEIKAPMPGLVLEVRIKPGDHVKTGDPLVILEAMKMENVISAGHDAIVDQVHIEKGQSVEKSEVMLTFKDE